MKLSDIVTGALDPQAWQGYELPKFDLKAVRQKTHDQPTWIHFGAGNIFRAFPAALLQRVLDALVDEEISIGDYVLTGGELPALVLTDCVARMLDGTLSSEAGRVQESHYDGLLEEDDLLRKDTIWFTEKNTDGSSALYPLTDFKGLNRISSLRKAYKFGKFGAVPNL